MPRCPVCRSPMTRVEERSFRQFTCSNCFGVLIADSAMTRMVRLDAQQLAAGTPDPVLAEANLSDLATLVSESDTKEQLRCPDCGKLMVREKFHAMIPVMVDRCKPCDDLFLNPGEMNLLRKLYAELMTTDDPEIVRRREKLATAMAQWEGRRTMVDDLRERTEQAEVMMDVGSLVRWVGRMI